MHTYRRRRLMLAAFVGKRKEMQAIRLKEVRHAAAHDGEVIDASYAVVRERRLWRAIKRALLAVVCAAVIGFAIPPLWVLAAQHFAQTAGAH